MPRTFIPQAGGNAKMASHNLYDFRAANETAGNIFIVDSGTASGGTSSSFGLSVDGAFTTLDSAIGNCTANNNDHVYVLAGHAENITTVTAINIDIAGVTIIGLGHGTAMPTFSSTAAAGSLTVGAASAFIKNLKFVSAFTNGTTAGITVAAAGDNCTLDGIVMRDTLTTQEHLIHVSVATTVADLVIKNCSLVGLAGGMTNSILFAGTSTNCVIEDNDIDVDSSDDVIDHLAGASVNLTIRRNQVHNEDTDTAGYCVRYKSDGTGRCHHNVLSYNEVNAEMVIGAAAFFFDNQVSNTAGESGKLDPPNTANIP